MSLCRASQAELSTMNKSGEKNEGKLDEVQQEKPEFEHTGQYLRKLRTDKELTIKDVTDTTRISEVNLNAIEAQDFPTLPADTFTRGLLTIYAEFLGVDPAKVVPQFMQERDASKSGGKRTRTKQPRKILAPKTLAEPSQVSSMTTAFILLIVIVVLFTVFCLYTSWNPFSFLADEQSEFQSIMMSVIPGTDPDIEQPGSGNLNNNTGISPPDAVNGERDNESPATDSLYSPQPPSGGNIEYNTQSPDSTPNSLTRSESTALVGNDKPAVLPKDMKGSAALSFPGNL